MTSTDLLHGWSLDQDSESVTLYGPGGSFYITLCPFIPSRLTRHQDAGLFTPTLLSWSYPLEEGVELQYSSTSMTDSAVTPLYLLHVGTSVTWHLPPETGRRFAAWCSAQKAQAA